MSGSRLGIGPSGPLAPSPRTGSRRERDRSSRTPFRSGEGTSLSGEMTITATTTVPPLPPTIASLGDAGRFQAAQVSIASRRRRRGLQRRQETVLTSELGLVGVPANTTRTLLGN